jgi:predicted ATPase
VQAVLAARIDRLPDREKRLLQTAAVIGKDFAEPLLATVAGLSAEQLKVSLAALARAEFIHEQAIYPVVEYSFKHPLTQEVALGSQLKERRRQVHAAVGRAIEQQHPDHLDERAALLAHHWEEANEALTAARWHKRAAEWSGRTDIGAAARHWGRVRALVRELPDSGDAAALGIDACRQVLGLSWRVGAGLDGSRTLVEEGRKGRCMRTQSAIGAPI